MLLGGEAALSDAVESAVQAAGYESTRLREATRFETAATGPIDLAPSVANAAQNPRIVGIATSLDFPNALAGSAFLDTLGRGAVVLLTQGEALDPAVDVYSRDNAHTIEHVFVFGGPDVVSEDSVAEIEGIFD